MENEEQVFNSIADLLSREIAGVTLGKMMSSPGIKYNNKVFAFFYDKKMVFKLGRDFKPESLGVTGYSHLSPFKTKPPLFDWFEISSNDIDKWQLLAKEALSRMQSTQ